jgi:hypothetical protein
MMPKLRTAQSVDWQSKSTASTDWCVWRGQITQAVHRNSSMGFPPASGCCLGPNNWQWTATLLFPLSWVVTYWNWEYSQVLTWDGSLTTVMRLNLMETLERLKTASPM